jgi:hypothetical protein
VTAANSVTVETAAWPAGLARNALRETLSGAVLIGLLHCLAEVTLLEANHVRAAWFDPLLSFALIASAAAAIVLAVLGFTLILGAAPGHVAGDGTQLGRRIVLLTAMLCYAAGLIAITQSRRSSSSS